MKISSRLKFFEIEDQLKKYNINHYRINNDMSIDALQNVNITYCRLTTLPFNFNLIDGSIDIRRNQLTSLIGLPESIYEINAESNNLKSLHGCSEHVEGNAIFNNNLLTNLYYMPKYVGKSLYLNDNKLITLQNNSNCKVVGQITVFGNPLPSEIEEYLYQIKDIVQFQNDYSIWNNQKLDVIRFEQMMDEIMSIRRQSS